MTETKRLSNSEVSLFKRCRRQWWLAYYRRLGRPEPDYGKPTGLGTRVHNALAELYKPGEAVTTESVLDFMRKEIDRDIERHPSYEDTIRKDGTLALVMMEGYLQWLEEEGLDQDLILVAPEEAVEVPLDDEEVNRAAHAAGLAGVNIISKLDVRVQKESDRSRWNLEHKTVQSLTQPVPLLQTDAQLLTEHLVEFLKLLEEGHADQRADGVLYNMLRKVKRTANAKPPFYGREEVRHNLEELRAHWRQTRFWALQILDATRQLNEGVHHQDVVPPSRSRDCTWQCPFAQVCLAGLFDDGSDVEGALADLYTEVDPLQRYSRDTEESDAEGGK